MPSTQVELLFICACVATLPMVRNELFTSMAHLQSALYAEKDIASTLRQYINAEEEKLQQLRRIADDLDSHSSQFLENPEHYFGNPVNAFLFVKRFTLDWDRSVEVMIRNNTWETLVQQLQYLKTDLPNYEDLSGAAVALMRLQDTYQLDTARIAQGDLAGVKSSPLSAEACFELGRIYYNEEDYYHTLLWMQQALEVLDKEENQTVSRAEVLDYLAFSTYKQGNLRQALLLTDELLLLAPDHDRARNNKRYYERMLLEEDDNSGRRGDEGKPSKSIHRQLDEYRNSEEFFAYEKLCRGEELVVIPDKHRLMCRYVTNNHPLLLLQPVKLEEVHLKPWIVVFHDVMSDKEIARVKTLATPKLNRATVQNSKTGQLETANYRISKSAWLDSGSDPVVSRINNRIQAITSLDVNTAEELQVANYGIGGHYEPHFDFARKDETEAFKSLGTGNRIATFLFYMTDVEAGGATVFPYIGVKLFPKKGTAAFWYNLYRNGNGIYDTRHAACPVLVGCKWVSNKWLHERGQEFRRPCSLTADE